MGFSLGGATNLIEGADDGFNVGCFMGLWLGGGVAGAVVGVPVGSGNTAVDSGQT